MHPPKEQNIPRGHKMFRDHVIPVLVANGWPATWQDQLGTDADLTGGVDYILEDGTTVAARVWNSYPQRHFALRWYNTRTPDILCELPKMLARLNAGQSLPDRVVEAFIYKQRVFIAIIDGQTLWQAVNKHHPYLPQFTVANNRGDFAIFCRASFDLFPGDAITKII